MSDRAEIFTTYSYICTLMMVIASTREIVSRLFCRFFKNHGFSNHRFLTENPVLDIHITLWRKTKVIFGISALNCIELYVAQQLFTKKFFLKKKGWGAHPAIFFRKIFFLGKSFYFLKNDFLSGILSFLVKWKPFLSKKTACPPVSAKASHCV